MPEKQTEKQFVITVVDDNPGVLQLTVRVLRTQGYRVLEARCGADALDAAERHDKPVDLLLTDIEMPGMDGISLWREMRARQQETRVVFMSGGAMPDDVDGEPFLSKPFTLATLVGIVEDRLNSHCACSCFETN
jgi:two-component system, cell cycle sensor histidine kinase and response regulator CckA